MLLYQWLEHCVDLLRFMTLLILKVHGRTPNHAEIGKRMIKNMEQFSCEDISDWKTNV